MGINLDNYEQYFLDHLEGSLSPKEESDLADFLAAHPELKPLLEDLDAAPVLDIEPVIFHSKEKLKKSIHPTVNIHERNAGEWMISSVEGLLDQQQEEELQEFLRINPSFRPEMEIFRKTVSSADESIVFPGKNKLKKKAPVFMIARSGWAAAVAAAVILLFFGINYIIEEDESPVSVTSEQVATVVKSPEENSGKDLPAAQNGPSAEFPEVSAPPAKPPVEAEESQLRPRPDAFRIHTGQEIAIATRENALTAFIPETRGVTTVQTIEPGNTSIFARVTNSLIADAGQSIRENTRLDKIRKPKLNFWSVISSGIKGYNTITDRDLELLVKTDDEGKVSSYALVEQDRLIMMRELDKN